MTEVQSQQESPSDRLPPAVINPITVELMTLSGIDPREWSDKYAGRVREMIEGDSGLRALAVQDSYSAAREVQKRLDAEDGQVH